MHESWRNLPALTVRAKPVPLCCYRCHLHPGSSPLKLHTVMLGGVQTIRLHAQQRSLVQMLPLLNVPCHTWVHIQGMKLRCSIPADHQVVHPFPTVGALPEGISNVLCRLSQYIRSRSLEGYLDCDGSAAQLGDSPNQSRWLLIRGLRPHVANV